MEGETIKTFRDLYCWKEGHKLVLMIYKMTDDFPKKKMFGLSSQMQRAAVSITSNIAEGFSRQTNKDKLHFYTMSQGSFTELQNELLIAKDINYISDSLFKIAAGQTVVVNKLINGLKKYLRNQTD